MNSKALLCVIGIIFLLVMWLFSYFYKKLLNAYEQSTMLTNMEYSWFFRLLLNIAGYSTILVPTFLVYKYLSKINYFDKISNKNYVYRILYACYGDPIDRIGETPRMTTVEETPLREGVELSFCFFGLMGAYLIWGILQEKIITQKYQMSDGTEMKFTDSQLLVFINRLLAFMIAACRLLCDRSSLVSAPLYKFSFSSLTNVISTWCQYEALKYVSFPTQVLSKSCKVIPVMMMGKLVSGNKYELYEYVTAVFISVGMVMFMFGSHDRDKVSTVSLLSGLSLLALYMCADSFTSSWQAALFSRYRCSPHHMMAAVNLFSTLLTASALLHKPDLTHSLMFFKSPAFIVDCVLLSLSSAIGQLLIFRTIARFGAVVFTIIMTLRQAVSILLSCLIYGHHLSIVGGFGVALVFLAVMLRMYCRHRRTRRLV